MKYIVLIILCFLISACSIHQTKSIEHQVKPKVNYQQAEVFLPNNIKNLVNNLNIYPNWIKSKKKGFWYEYRNKDNHQSFMRYLPQSNNFIPLFDKKKLERALSKVTNTKISWDNKPISQLTFSEDSSDKSLLNFVINQQSVSCEISKNYQCKKSPKPQEDPNKHYSPNKDHYIVIENYNLKLCKAHHKCQFLTNDGTEQKPYAIRQPNPETILKNPSFNEQQDIALYWSSDSRHIVTYQMNREGVTKLTMTDSAYSDDFSVNSTEYYYPQAGDQNTLTATPVLIDTKSHIVKKFVQKDVIQTYYGSAIWGKWSNGYFYYVDNDRNHEEYRLNQINASNFTIKTLITETDQDYIDPWSIEFHIIPDTNKVIWASERSGYRHYYLYDIAESELESPLTYGNYRVKRVKHIEHSNNIIYFTASGKEPNRDPYLSHLYRLDLNSSKQTLLTPEPFEHSVFVSPDSNYFVDTYSNPNSAPVTVLRSKKNGSIIRQVLEADISNLLATGWNPPETFKVLAPDNKTYLYGLIYKPTHFDPEKKYPIIEDIYTGPHGYFTPKSFYTYNNHRQSIAELGFIVIKMDGRGTSGRSKNFQRYSFKNLAKGSDDHVWAIKKLAESRPYMDISKVGIYGFSAGGYDTFQAMTRHADFYKVGVTASGNHDFRVDKMGWNEVWMDWPVNSEWDKQSNYNNIDNFKGKVLIAHGELDSNVPPSASIRLADFLLKKQKDFEFLLLPKMGHYLDSNISFVKKRWRFFVEHLLE